MAHLSTSWWCGRAKRALADVSAICALYNATIPTTTAAWTEQLDSDAERRAWLVEQDRAGYTTLVADDGGLVVGFAAFGDFRDTAKWPGYRFVVELSVHIDRSRWGRGVGRALVTELIARAQGAGKTHRRCCRC